ncbi:hypothetical protein GH714_005703 [Hevea brasiliensis]|uniref:Pectate lyase n=1 Tax=Hevea brasiliensis TaxID=3981 RepID=A0A6A6KCA5_HEVBR|nr:hypothetical protein GH714_005703 [Hevea brasiliensis]
MVSMAVPSKWVCVCAAVLVLMFVGVAATVRNDGISGLSRNEETEKLQSSKNSSMAASSGEDIEAWKNEHAVDDPEEVVAMVEMSIRNSTERRRLGYFSCGTGNPIDDCWRCDPNWEKNRKRLAECGIGFGRNAIGGRDGPFYVVTDPSVMMTPSTQSLELCVTL